MNRSPGPRPPAVNKTLGLGALKLHRSFLTALARILAEPEPLPQSVPAPSANGGGDPAAVLREGPVPLPEPAAEPEAEWTARTAVQARHTLDYDGDGMPDSPTLWMYLDAIWRRKGITILVVVVAMAVVVAGTHYATPTYEATATVHIDTASQITSDYVDYNQASRVLNTYVAIAGSRQVISAAAAALDLDYTPAVGCELISETELLQITVEDTDPAVAAAFANKMAETVVNQGPTLYRGDTGRTTAEILEEQLLGLRAEINASREQLAQLQTETPTPSDRIDTLTQSITRQESTYASILDQYDRARVAAALSANALSVVDRAAVPTEPSSPNALLNYAVGLVASLAAGVGLSLLIESRETTLLTSEGIEAATGLPLLGQIPRVRGRRKRGLLGDSPETAAAYGQLRASLFALDESGQRRAILVTSAEPGDGKSTVAASIARASALAGRNVLLIDADMRLPTIHQLLGLPNELGLSSVLADGVAAVSAIQTTDTPGLSVLTSGRRVANAGELLSGVGIAPLLERMSVKYDLIFVDAPAVLPVPDAAEIASDVDGVIMVVSRARTKRMAIRAAQKQLSQVGAKVLGLVVNRAEQKGGRYYSYYR